MKNKTVFMVYAGTQGTAGLYLYPILEVLNKTRLKIYAFTSFYYPFQNAKKYFFKLTDLAGVKQKNKFRPYIRYIELCWALLRIFVKALIDRPILINYSLNSSYYPEYIFLLASKKLLKIPLIITCHDVMPFSNAYLSNNSELKRRKKIFDLANYLLVHNEHSKITLLNSFEILQSKILYHRFPIMDLNILDSTSNEKNIDFLFIGHLRKEKGIEILLSAWEKFHNQFPQATLYIAGNLPANNNICISMYKGQNIEFDLKYVNDKKYIELIKRTKCLILPYTMGTNSGIPSSALSVGTNVITSDLPMFLENELIDKKLIFKNGEPDDLLKKMIYFYKLQDSNINFDDNLNDYHNIFDKEVKDLYLSLS